MPLQGRGQGEQTSIQNLEQTVAMIAVALGERVTAFHTLHKDISKKCMEQLVHKAVDRVGGMASFSNIDQSDERFLNAIMIYTNSLVQVYHTMKKNKANSRVIAPWDIKEWCQPIFSKKSLG
ncbi:hypothetical protein BDQ17DRAFT_1332356 [Cyathus striatus]|nr:hypothetical protein BDQ17DRAFT_1332356 [Cyathus striatus]